MQENHLSQLFQKSWIINDFHERIDDRYKADYVIFQKIQNPWFFLLKFSLWFLKSTIKNSKNPSQ
jgi:hypothetical protein